MLQADRGSFALFAALAARLSSIFDCNQIFLFCPPPIRFPLSMPVQAGTTASVPLFLPRSWWGRRLSSPFCRRNRSCKRIFHRMIYCSDFFLTALLCVAVILLLGLFFRGRCFCSFDSLTLPRIGNGGGRSLALGSYRIRGTITLEHTFCLLIFFPPCTFKTLEMVLHPTKMSQHQQSVVLSQTVR